MNIRKYALPLVLAVGGLAGISSPIYNNYSCNRLEEVPEVKRYDSLLKQSRSLDKLSNDIREIFVGENESSLTRNFLGEVNQMSQDTKCEINALESRDEVKRINERRGYSEFGGIVFTVGLVLLWSAIESFNSRCKFPHSY